MTKLKGWKNYDKALAASRYASTNPSVRQLDDGSYVGVGDTLLMSNGSCDSMLYGKRRAALLSSEYDSAEAKSKGDATPYPRTTCTVESHARLKNDRAEWERGTFNRRVIDLCGELVESGECRQCLESSGINGTLYYEGATRSA